MIKILAAINAGLVVLEGAVHQLPGSDSLHSLIGVLAAIGIAVISSYIGPTAIKALAKSIRSG